MQPVALDQVPASHPALRLLEQVVGRVAYPPVPAGQITLYVNGGRITDINPDYLLPQGADFSLRSVPLNLTQRTAIQAVAELLPQLEQTRIDCRLVLHITDGQPQLPLLFQGRYPVVYEQERPVNTRRVRRPADSP